MDNVGHITNAIAITIGSIKVIPEITNRIQIPLIANGIIRMDIIVEEDIVIHEIVFGTAAEVDCSIVVREYIVCNPVVTCAFNAGSIAIVSEVIICDIIGIRGRNVNAIRAVSGEVIADNTVVIRLSEIKGIVIAAEMIIGYIILLGS